MRRLTPLVSNLSLMVATQNSSHLTALFHFEGFTCKPVTCKTLHLHTVSNEIPSASNWPRLNLTSVPMAHCACVAFCVYLRVSETAIWKQLVDRASHPARSAYPDSRSRKCIFRKSHLPQPTPACVL